MAKTANSSLILIETAKGEKVDINDNREHRAYKNKSGDYVDINESKKTYIDRMVDKMVKLDNFNIIIKSGSNDYLDTNDDELNDDDEITFWDMVNLDNFKQHFGSNDYSDSDTQTIVTEYKTKDKMQFYSETNQQHNYDTIKKTLDKKTGKHIKKIFVADMNDLFSVHSALVSSILQKSSSSNMSYNLGKYKLCKPVGLQKFVKPLKGAGPKTYEKLKKEESCQFEIGDPKM